MKSQTRFSDFARIGISAKQIFPRTEQAFRRRFPTWKFALSCACAAFATLIERQEDPFPPIESSRSTRLSP